MKKRTNPRWYSGELPTLRGWRDGRKRKGVQGGMASEVGRKPRDSDVLKTKKEAAA